MNGHVDKYLDHGVVGIAQKDSPVYADVSEKSDGRHYPGEPQLSSRFDSMKPYVQ